MISPSIYLHLLNWRDTAIGVVSYLSIIAAFVVIGAIAAGII